MTRQYRTAAVIGTGMMGPGIAATLALGGVKATILSRTAESAQKGLAAAVSLIDLLERNELASPSKAALARGNLSASGQFAESISGVDLVIESAPENLSFKQDLFEKMDALAPPSTVLTSNTSGLSITAIAERCVYPERVVTTHFWNPPHLMPLVEIVRGKKTEDDVVTSLRELLTVCGKVPVVVKKDTPGQLGNRLQQALVREAVNIVEQGIADVEDVDLAAKAGFGLRLPVYGIFEHQDAVGLDMCLTVADYVSQDLYNEPRAPEYMRNLVRDGHLGAKTGKGFYDWSKKDINAVKARRDQFILDFLRAQNRQ
jgi:3-hydroxybutyryl-CoA dehydrogenase